MLINALLSDPAPDPDPRKEIEVDPDPDPDLDPERGMKWIRIRNAGFQGYMFQKWRIMLNSES